MLMWIWLIGRCARPRPCLIYEVVVYQPRAMGAFGTVQHLHLANVQTHYLLNHMIVMLGHKTVWGLFSAIGAIIH